MMEVRKFGDLAFHACDFAFDDCSTPHLPDVGLQPAWLRCVLEARYGRLATGAARRGRSQVADGVQQSPGLLQCMNRCRLSVACPNHLQAWFAGLVAFEKARVLKCKVASRMAFDTGLTHRQWPEIG